MKMNKKIIVPFLSTVVGLSLAGGVGGAFAWYQYNSQVTASFVGTSVADTSVLQIGHDATRMVPDDPEDPNGTKHAESYIAWGRDYSVPNGNLVPVTFGQLVTSDAPASKPNCLPSQAYGSPEAGKQVNENYSSWMKIDPNDGYAQFKVYLKAVKADKVTQADLDVYLSDITIQGVGETSAASSKLVSDAVRIHLNVDNDKNRLISKTAIGTHVEGEGENAKTVGNLNLYGPLDLDGNGENDKPAGYSWETSGSSADIVYGRQGDTQTTEGIADVKHTRNEDGTFTTNASKKICTTKTSGNVEITITVWLEGWHLLKSEVDGENVTNSAVWNPTYSADLDVRVGLTFDVGKVRL